MIYASTIETLPSGWNTQLISFRRTDPNLPEESRPETVEISTGTRYGHELMFVTSVKCIGLFFAAKLYCAAYMILHLLRAPLVAIRIAVQSVFDCFSQFSLRKIGQTIAAIFWKAPLALLKNLWAVVSAPFYTIAFEFSCLYGICSPLRARVWIAKIEKSWHGDRTRFQDWRDYRITDSFVKTAWGALSDPNHRMTFFLAACMQPLGFITDENVTRRQILVPSQAS